MKKIYMTPEVEIVQIKTPVLLAGSIGSDELGGLGGYGGIDEEGDVIPSSRLFDDLLGIPM